MSNPLAVVVAMIALLMATLNVNVAANVVSPANDFSNLWPRRISFRTGGLITCLMGIVMQPWRLLANYGNYVFGWLVGYSGFLGPIAGVLICDYFVIRKKIILTEDLYRRNGAYEFSGGVNWRAIAALAMGCGSGVRGLVYAPLRVLYDYAWFVGFGVSFLAYSALMIGSRLPTRRWRLVVAARQWRRRSVGVRICARLVVPAHGRLAGVDLLHGDAILDRADQRAQIAADAFFLDDARHVHAHALARFFFRSPRVTCRARCTGARRPRRPRSRAGSRCTVRD